MRAMARIPRSTGAGDKILGFGGGYGAAQEPCSEKLVFCLKLSLASLRVSVSIERKIIVMGADLVCTNSS